MEKSKEREDGGEKVLHQWIQNLQLSSEDGEEEEETDASLVGLGFVQQVEQAWKVARHHFPSKVGGTPAWLDPINIPYDAQSTCGICDNPLEFLLQVYAPIDEQDDAFHRTVFLFMCSSMACLQQDQRYQLKQPVRSVRVFRSQLPRKNSFYSYNPPSGEHDNPSCEGVALCTWCGAWKGRKACAACKQARYCSRSHQIEHWRDGHSGFCRQFQATKNTTQPSDANGASTPSTDGAKHEGIKGIPAATSLPVSGKLWPEWELIVDDEDNYDADDVMNGNSGPQSMDPTNKAQRLLDEYERRRKSGEEFTAADMQDVQEASQDLQHWAAFQARIARAPAQVLRYCRSTAGKPLWPLLEGNPKNTDIPACSHCGSHRVFEFQVLPQLLHFLQLKNDSNSLDWGTIAVYTCAKSCTAAVTKGYAEEFAWTQCAPE